ncbi:MAG: hypothetical protein LBK95_17555 [Bifidobacteriaceae bacterium]|nr:hypothetical protein [Bifidobacteriaceae bacterium]
MPNESSGGSLASIDIGARLARAPRPGTVEGMSGWGTGDGGIVQLKPDALGIRRDGLAAPLGLAAA